MAIGVERNAVMIPKGEKVPLSSTITLVVSNGQDVVDSLAIDSLDMAPVESLDSDLEKWF